MSSDKEEDNEPLNQENTLSNIGKMDLIKLYRNIAKNEIKYETKTETEPEDLQKL